MYTEPDALSLHVLEAEEKVCLGTSTREYTNAAKLLEAATSTGCDALTHMSALLCSCAVMLGLSVRVASPS